MDNWDEIRTAYQVARNGTVSGAAEALGVHHATVIRHIDALEGRLGVKLFHRHARGYTATEAGADLLQVAQTTDDQFTQLAGRIKGQGEGVKGELIVTSLDFLSPFMTPVLLSFQDQHPSTTIRYLTGERLFRLEYGEAHVAVRAGQKPAQPDNVVQDYFQMPIRLAASDTYIARKGMPSDEADLKNHEFIGADDADSRAPHNIWMREHVSGDQQRFRTTTNRTVWDAVIAGAGLGFVTDVDMQARADLHEVIPTKDEWKIQLWLVTHVDLHRTAKVQACLTHLKEAAALACSQGQSSS